MQLLSEKFKEILKGMGIGAYKAYKIISKTGIDIKVTTFTGYVYNRSFPPYEIVKKIESALNVPQEKRTTQEEYKRFENSYKELCASPLDEKIKESDLFTPKQLYEFVTQNGISKRKFLNYIGISDRTFGRFIKNISSFSLEKQERCLKAMQNSDLICKLKEKKDLALERKQEKKLEIALPCKDHDLGLTLIKLGVSVLESYEKEKSSSTFEEYVEKFTKSSYELGAVIKYFVEAGESARKRLRQALPEKIKNDIMKIGTLASNLIAGEPNLSMVFKLEGK